jgi:glycerol uptake facilitator-like aquaporin
MITSLPPQYFFEGLVTALLSAFVCNYHEYTFLVISSILGIITTVTLKTGFYNPVFSILQYLVGTLTIQESAYFILAQFIGMFITYFIYVNRKYF